MDLDSVNVRAISQVMEVSVFQGPVEANFARRTVHNNMLMHRSAAVEQSVSNYPSDRFRSEGCLTSHTFQGYYLFGGEKAYDKECASTLTVNPLRLTTKPYTGHGKSFSKGGSSYIRDQDRSAPAVSTTKPPKSGDSPSRLEQI